MGLCYTEHTDKEALMRYVHAGIAISWMIIACFSCQPREKGTIQGTVTPASAGVRVNVTSRGSTVASSAPDEHTGKFSVSVDPGSYDVTITSPSSPFPLSFPAVEVAPEKPAVLGVIEMSPFRGAASISGKIRAATSARVTLLLDGQERSSVETDRTGRYELKELPAGRYSLHVQAPGYADDGRSVDIADGQRVALNIALLYRSQIDGVDWSQGTIRALGIGSAPPQAVNATVKREMAKRAALADAERNLLRGVQMIETGPGEKLSTFLGPRLYTQTIEGYVQGFRMVAERQTEGGKVEVELELPLTGPGGLSSRLPAE